MGLTDNRETLEILAFEIAGRRYALPASQVRELVRAVAIVPLADAPPTVEGVIDVRGEIVPVLDIRAHYGLPAKLPAPADQLILATAGNRTVAIRVERALGLSRLEPDARRDLRSLIPGASDPSAIGRVGDGLVIVQDLEALLADGDIAP